MLTWLIFAGSVTIYMQLHTYYVFPWVPYMYTLVHESVSLKDYIVFVVAALSDHYHY